MERITQKHLEGMAARINHITNNPEKPWTYDEDTKRNTANIGNYHISYAYGGACLHRIMSDGGGVNDVLRCGHIKKRALYERMAAFIAGISIAGIGL